ncbi:MAG: hypothetical protein GYA17_04575 [Chloroflexi bacterium]|nr:hypothetical protein [Chloroflexota bacterium]
MIVHLIGGDFGCGKTAHILAAAREMQQRGTPVGVVVYTPGQLPVDALAYQAANLPTLALPTGQARDAGAARLARFYRLVRPQVVFVELPGSFCGPAAGAAGCFYPLAEGDAPGYTVVANAAQLQPARAGDGSGAAGRVLRQAAGAGRLLLYGARDGDGALEAWRAALPGVAVQCAGPDAPAGPWENAVSGGAGVAQDEDGRPQGVPGFTWVEARAEIHLPHATGRQHVTRLAQAAAGELRSRGGLLHLKFFFQGVIGKALVSMGPLAEDGWERRVPLFSGDRVNLWVNSWWEGDAAGALPALEAALTPAGDDPGVQRAAFEGRESPA